MPGPRVAGCVGASGTSALSAAAINAAVACSKTQSLAGSGEPDCPVNRPSRKAGIN